MHSESHFLNVDLDVKSRQDLTPLVEALGKVILLHEESTRRHWVRLEVGCPKTPAAGILSFAKRLSKLPSSVYKLWKRATKEFDIGVQAGSKSGSWLLEPEVVQAVARLGAQLRVTVYSPLLADTGGRPGRVMQLGTRLIREGDVLAEVPIAQMDDGHGGGGWGPYISVHEAQRLDDVRAALRAGDLDAATRLGTRLYRLVSVEL